MIDQNVSNIVFNIIENLPSDAINELLSGYDNDLDLLIDDLILETNNVINNNQCSIKDFGSLSNFERSFDESLKIHSYNYFKTTMLPNFRQNWRNIEMGNLIQLYPYSAYICERSSGKSFEMCNALPLWRLYRYRKPKRGQKNTVDNKNSKETVIITYESKLGRKHLAKIAEEIKDNDLLKETLFPSSMNDALGKERIVANNGASVDLRTFGSAIRGLHVGMVIVDDFLDKSCLYSKEQRNKFKEVFYGDIGSIVEPLGYLIVAGTPFTKDDLYNDLKNDPAFKVFEYPGIYPNGELLAPDRFTYKQLMQLKKSFGTVVFSREHLVTPITDSSSIFPYNYLMTSIVGMENISLVRNIESYPIKLKRVVAGVDFAISGNVAADFTVISVWGMDSNNNYYLIYIEKGQGWSHNEQVSRIISVDNRFKPNKIYVENNGFQRIMGDMVKQRGVKTIEGFITDEKLKKDDKEGLPSLSAIFERGEIKVPYKEGWSKDLADELFGQFNSIGFNEDTGKLQAVSGHDDMVMSCFFCIHKLRTKTGFKISYIGE